MSDSAREWLLLTNIAIGKYINGMPPRLFHLVLALKQRCIATETRLQKSHTLSPAEFHGLLATVDEASLSGSDFAARMGLSLSRASRVLAKLVKRGLVTLDEVPDDRRSIAVRLTNEGSALKRAVESDLTDCESRVLSTLSEPEQQQVLASVSTLISKLH